MVQNCPPAGPRSRRLGLPALGLAAALALVPGTALAEETPAPPGEITDVLEGEAPAGGGATTTSEEPPAGEPPAFEVPPELVAAFQELAAQAGISEECVTGVAESIELIGNGIAGLPAELEALVTDLGAAVQEAIETEDPAPVQEFLEGLQPAEEEGSEQPAPPIGGDIAAGLQQLSDTLASEECRPAPPEQPEEEQPAAPQGQEHTPVQGPAQQAPPPPPAQAVVYPGYAPTGADGDDEGLPLAPLALAAVGAAAGAIWTGRRWRAAPDGG